MHQSSFYDFKPKIYYYITKINNKGMQTLIHYAAPVISSCTLMSYFVLSCKGEESVNKLLSPVPDPNPLCIKPSQSEQFFLSYVPRQTDKETQMHDPHTPIQE